MNMSTKHLSTILPAKKKIYKKLFFCQTRNRVVVYSYSNLIFVFKFSYKNLQ